VRFKKKLFRFNAAFTHAGLTTR